MAIESQSQSPRSSADASLYEDAGAKLPVHQLPGAVIEAQPPPGGSGTGKAPGASQRQSPRSWVHPLTAKPTTAPWLRYSVALVVGVGSLILLIGFLAWNIPFTRLQNTIKPLGYSIRKLVMTNVQREVQGRWDTMRKLAMTFRQRWDIEGQPMDPIADVNLIGKMVQPMIQQFPFVGVAPYLMLQGTCVFTAALQLHPTLGWRMARQNCTNRWLEQWNQSSCRVTGKVLGVPPWATAADLFLYYPMNLTNRSQPFTWLPLYDPGVGLGNLFVANVALFGNHSDTASGRFGVGVSVADLGQFLLEQVQGQEATVGGRMALYDNNLKVVATSHGNVNSPQITSVGDADLEAAVRHLLSSGHWCATGSSEITLSQRYFLDVFLIADPYPSVIQLQCCAILLSPRDNTMAEVDRSTYFAIAFVCCMTLGSATIAVLLGLLVTRPLQRLTKGMRALKEYEFTSARQVTRDGASWFREMHYAMDSYRSLVEAMYAFGKYVPRDIVKGLLAGQVRPELGMTEERVALCFMDIANFTTMCETIPASEIVKVTSMLFDRCCDTILGTQGTIDKFIGDCIMCLWGAPVMLAHPEGQALQAVLEILSMLRNQPICLHTGQRLQLRIGLNAGSCLVGNFGATSRWEYTAIGDVVNTASRMEALNKQFSTMCLASASIYDGLRDVVEYQWMQQHMRSMGDVLLVGKFQPVPVYEVLPSPLDPADLEAWEHTLELCRNGHLTDAMQRLEELPGDEAAEAMLRDVAGWSPTGPYVRSMRGK
eukprot:GGOE01028283.1.p1 GENE.GGOE01028283.1~~GGOE01028283.1.p1  ORF type:complete len:767 (-),score=233.17 GGOE01028283.1:1017-3317(-)